MASWWERFPGRLEAELADFAARGLRFERDETLFRDSGRLLLRGNVQHEERQVELEVLYPDLFPYFRPEVFAPGVHLDRHQSPVAGNLCLLDGGSAAWKPHETGAWLVAERVPKLLTLFEQGPEVMRGAEVEQGEPISAYFMAAEQPGTAIFVPAAALELPRDARVGSGRLCFAAEAPPHLGIRALLCELVEKPGGARKTKLLARADSPLSERFGGTAIQMRWVRLGAPPEQFTAEGLLAAADAAQPGFGRPPWQHAADGEIAVTGAILDEEVRQGVLEDTWLFAVRWRRAAGAKVEEGSYIIPGERLTPGDLGARIPKLAPLRSATVAQIGLGALGAPLALELARNQIGALRMVEFDRVEVGQTVRWPFGLQFVGRYKLNSLASFIEQNYPFTAIERFQHRLGQTGVERHARTESELDMLVRMLDGVDLAIDASAELRVQQLIADFARERGITQLFLSATEGARGGQVALIIPGHGGCWFCWKLHTEAVKNGRRAITLPPYDSDGRVQPRGCASATFTGASFDLLPIVAQAARAVAVALQPQSERPSSTVWVCAISSDGVTPPEWTTYPLEIHPRCPACEHPS
jgi:molybdopterin/thiamine biosynthesis adenylyltransferase